MPPVIQYCEGALPDMDKFFKSKKSPSEKFFLKDKTTRVVTLILHHSYTNTFLLIGKHERKKLRQEKKILLYGAKSFNFAEFF
jgi:hypothetical protein